MVFFIVLILAVPTFFFLRAVWLFGKAGYYRYFASERQIDEAFKKEVLSKDPNYKAFESTFDKEMDSFLKDRN